MTIKAYVEAYDVGEKMGSLRHYERVQYYAIYAGSQRILLRNGYRFKEVALAYAQGWNDANEHKRSGE